MSTPASSACALAAGPSKLQRPSTLCDAMAHSGSRGAGRHDDEVGAHYGLGRGSFGGAAPLPSLGEEPPADRADDLPRELRGVPRHRQGAIEEIRSQLLPALQAQQNAAWQFETEPRIYKSTREIRRLADARVSPDADGLRDRYSDRLPCGEVKCVSATGRGAPEAHPR